MVRHNVDCLLGEVINVGQDLDPPTAGQVVHNEVPGPDLTRRRRQLQSLPFHSHDLAPHRQPRVVIEPVNPLGMDRMPATPQQGVNARVAEPPPESWAWLMICCRSCASTADWRGA